MLKIVSAKEAENVRTIRCYAANQDFRLVSADICQSSKGCGGVFVKTDNLRKFATGRLVPKEVLEALTDGQQLVTAYGWDYTYTKDDIGDLYCSKIIPQGEGPWAFDGMCESEATPYTEPITFRYGVNANTLLRAWHIGLCWIELHSSCDWGRAENPINGGPHLFNFGPFCIYRHPQRRRQ